MDKIEFQSYCEKVNKMNIAVPNWYCCPPSIIGDYLRQSTLYGYGQVLERLLIPAYKIVKDFVKTQKFTGDNGELYELASLLSVKARIDEYCFSAYYFAVCVVAASLFGAIIDEGECQTFDENELIKFDCSVPVQGELDPQSKQLKKFSIRLLDFSRSNQLVHFRPMKSVTMSLLSRDTFSTIRLLTKRGAKIYIAGWKKLKPQMIYKCKICGSMDYYDYDFSAKKVQPARECPICDEGNLHNRKSMLPLKERLTCIPQGGYLCSCGNRIKVDKTGRSSLVCTYCGKAVETEFAPIISRNQLNIYGADEVVSATGDNASGEAAKTLLNRARSMERNFGLHVLYLACGFLKWKDVNGTQYNSPLLLCPVNLGIDKSKGQYYFEADVSSDSSFEVNKTLIQMLSAYSKTCSIALPQLDETNVGAYFTQMKQSFLSSNDAVRDITKDWEIEQGLGIGLFHYQKLQLQHDIETNREKYLQHPIIRRLCGDKNAQIDPPVLQQRHSTEFLLLDADSSQEDVIKASQEGKSFILQGPPGSGKSQTITNVIASALGEGKTVLFVTEKYSARSVIIDNLLRCSAGSGNKLTDFVLDFDSFKKRNGAVGRNPFVAELNKYLTPYNPVGGYDDQLLAEEEVRHRQLEKFMQQVRGEYNGRNYLRIVQDMAQYSSVKGLDEMSCIPTDRVDFTELCDLIDRYYIAIDKCGDSIDYACHPLYGCKGDTGNELFKIATRYLETCTSTDAVADRLKGFGWQIDYRLNAMQSCAEQLGLWSKMPELSEVILKGLNGDKAAKLLERAKQRKDTVVTLKGHGGAKYEGAIDPAALKSLNLSEALKQSLKYEFFFRRLGKKYRTWRADIFACFKDFTQKRNFKNADQALIRLCDYNSFSKLRETDLREKREDISFFGYEPADEGEWDKLIAALTSASVLLSKSDGKFINLQKNPAWTMRFKPSSHAITVGELQGLERQLSQAIACERALSGSFSQYAVTRCDGFLAYRNMAENVVANRTALGDWRRLYDALNRLENRGWLPVLRELIDNREHDSDRIKSRLSKSYYKKSVNEFVEQNGLDYISGFNRTEHEKLMLSYAKADRNVLDSGASRLYEVLKTNLKQAAAAHKGRSSGEYPKLQSKAHYSIKQTILENWDYVKRIKPCFMMSPLNVSQYVDVDVKFDLVIFDEASQVFTEDALASVMRGKQVIIAGDSKQLPPCDFFKAGESIQDDDDQYFEEEANTENSLLTAADGALSDASIALTWHYRSCDEALIAFANKEMEYNLISFPSAKRDVNNGICYVPVAYTPATCYVAGKAGAHVNIGEADKIVELIYAEITHPERNSFSIGVVAFSNAQANEIEMRWEAFKNQPDKKAVIERWERAHEDEPLIFCNLDTVQGDERDITIISVCYSPDCNGRFTLPYLGRVRLLSGMKRINVAITRAKHRMIVVSTLQSHELKTAIMNSSAPEENKAGAQMLCNFLEYAQSFSNAMEVVSARSRNPFVADICRVLDENLVEYDTEIGRSDCKINIGIRSAKEKGSYVLGIIVDDPGRADFDSVREYARLTEQVLSRKYGWKIYRIYPTAWVEDYETEKKNLLKEIRRVIAI